VHPSLVKKVGLEIGKCQVSYQRLLEMYLGLIAPEEGLTNASFVITLAPVLFRCNDCDTLFEPSRELFWCPNCNSSNVTEKVRTVELRRYVSEGDSTFTYFYTDGFLRHLGNPCWKYFVRILPDTSDTDIIQHVL